MKYLIIGGESSIALALKKKISELSNNTIDCTTRQKKNINKNTFYLDLHDNTFSLPERDYDIAFILAGITSIKDCELNSKTCYDVNVTHTIQIINRLSATGCKIIFPSTNLVYDGTIPFIKSTTPISANTNYGKYKAEVEKHILSLPYSHSIIRLSKILNTNQHLFKQWIEDLKLGKSVYAYKNYIFSPITMNEACNCILKISHHPEGGIWQFSANDEITYYQAACFIAKKLGLNSELVKNIKADSSKVEYIPQHTTFDSTRVNNLLNIASPGSLTTINNLIR